LRYYSQPASQFHNSYYCYSALSSSPVLRFQVFPVPTLLLLLLMRSSWSASRVLRGARARGYRSIEVGACLAVLLIRRFEAEGRRGAAAARGVLTLCSLDLSILDPSAYYPPTTYLPTYLPVRLHPGPSTRLELVGWWTRLESSIHAHVHAHAHAPHVPN